MSTTLYQTPTKRAKSQPNGESSSHLNGRLRSHSVPHNRKKGAPDYSLRSSMIHRCRLFTFRVTGVKYFAEVWDTLQQPFEGLLPPGEQLAADEDSSRNKLAGRMQLIRKKFKANRVGFWGNPAVVG